MIRRLETQPVQDTVLQSMMFFWFHKKKAFHCQLPRRPVRVQYEGTAPKF